jgi:hypothetical protein
MQTLEGNLRLRVTVITINVIATKGIFSRESVGATDTGPVLTGLPNMEIGVSVNIAFSGLGPGLPTGVVDCMHTVSGLREGRATRACK